MGRYLDIIRRPQRLDSGADSKLLIDNTLYNDNAYISDIDNTFENTEQEQVWSQEDSCVATGGFQEAAPVHEPSCALYDALNAFTQKMPEPGTAPPAEPEERISVRYVFEDDGAPPAPVDPPGPDAPLPGGIGFDVEGVGRVWLVQDESEAERLNLPPGRWLTVADLELLAPLTPEERRGVLTYMVHLKGRISGCIKPN